MSQNGQGTCKRRRKQTNSKSSKVDSHSLSENQNFAFPLDLKNDHQPQILGIMRPQSDKRQTQNSVKFDKSKQIERDIDIKNNNSNRNLPNNNKSSWMHDDNGNLNDSVQICGIASSLNRENSEDFNGFSNLPGQREDDTYNPSTPLGVQVCNTIDRSNEEIAEDIPVYLNVAVKDLQKIIQSVVFKVCQQS